MENNKQTITKHVKQKPHTSYPSPKAPEYLFLETGKKSIFIASQVNWIFCSRWFGFFSAKKLLLSRPSFILPPFGIILAPKGLKSIILILHLKPSADLHLWTKASGSKTTQDFSSKQVISENILVRPLLSVLTLCLRLMCFKL